MPSPALITRRLGILTSIDNVFDRFTPLPVNGFPNKLASNVPNNTLRKSPFYS